MSTAVKAALEDLLQAHRLRRNAPALRGEDRRLSPLGTGQVALDGFLGGGFLRGQVSEIHGPASSGRTGLVLAVVARSTRSGLAAWVDPADRFHPASAGAAGIDLSRLLWLRGDPRSGRGLPEAVSAVGVLLGSGLFETVVMDLGGVPATDVRRLPGSTWIRLQRMVEGTAVALLILADVHITGPGGTSLALDPKEPRWSGHSGPGRLLSGLRAEARAGRLLPRRASLLLE